MKFLKLFDFSLGRDFWNYRLGQLISLLGDSCSGIALAWWILDKTGSAAAMSQVLAPAMIVRLFLLPLLGPLGDNFSRKKLVILADAWRFIFTAFLAAMVFFNYFNVPLLSGVYILLSVGSALFNTASSAIVPQLVPRENLQIASQQTQAINSFAGIIGGVIGGLVVTFVGVFGAFVLDAFSYLAAALMASLIRASTKPARASKHQDVSSLIHWKNELVSGFKMLYKIPVLFWLCLVAMLMNLALSPLGIILPVLAKEGRNMPPWFLGGLESSISLGAIVGAFSITVVQRYLRPHFFFVGSIAMIGMGTMLLPWVPNLLLPLVVLFWIGIGSSWANIPLGTQISLSVPNAYLSRIGSIMNFLCNGISPLGVAGAGLLISNLGLTPSLVFMGGGLVILTPLILLIPQFKEFLGASPQEAGEFFNKNYPHAF